MEGLKAKIKRKLSIHDKNPNFDDVDHDELDAETAGHLHREYNTAEDDDAHPHGKPGSFLNRLILHGNKKTEDQLAQEAALAHKQQAALAQEAAIGHQQDVNLIESQRRASVSQANRAQPQVPSKENSKPIA